MGLGISADAQGRGGRGGGRGGGPEFPTEQQWAESAEAQKRVATAMKIGGSDLAPQARMFCTPTGPQRMALARQAAGLPPMPNVVVEPTRVFDNMWWIGMTSQNIWAITTSEGIILLDTMNSADEARDVIVPGMKKAGLDPAQIKYIVIGHGHPGQSDHTGGALYLQKTYGAKVIMSPIDARLVLPTQRPDRPLAVPDVDAAHGQKLTLGDTTLTLVHIPGHTPGTMGVIVPVKLRGASHSVIVLAATQMPSRESLVQFERVFNEFAKPMRVEASLNMHANGVQSDLEFLEQIRTNPNGQNPYLYGPERFSRWMDIMIECGRARLAALGGNSADSGPAGGGPIAALLVAQESRGPQSAIPGVIAAGAQVQEVRGGFKGLEGPVAAPDGGLFFSDIPASITYTLEPNGSITVWRENTGGANGLFLARDGRLLAAEGMGRRIVAITPDKRVTPLATQYNGQPLRAPNDVIADTRGGVYFTDPAPRPAPDVAPKEPGNVHYLTPKGEVLLLDGQIRRPNGLTLSIDEKTLYVGDTEGEFVYAFDVGTDGRVSNKRQFARLLEPEKGSFGPRSRADGMAIDAMGRLYVSTAAGIQVIDSRGQHLGIIRLPSVARNVAFGGKDRRTLYLTALESLYRVQMLAEGPAGRSK